MCDDVPVSRVLSQVVLVLHFFHARYYFSTFHSRLSSLLSRSLSSPQLLAPSGTLIMQHLSPMFSRPILSL